jgi:hypothetical protein
MRASAVAVLVCLALGLSGCRVAGWFFDALLGEPIVLNGQSREDNPTIHPKMLMEPKQVPAYE